MQHFVKNRTTANSRYKKLAAVFAVLLLLSLALPFLIGGDRIIVTAHAMASFVANGQTAGILMLCAVGFCLLAAAIGMLVKHKGVLAWIGAVLAVVGAVTMAGVVFNAKSAADYTNILGEEFLVWNLSVGYYYMLAACMGLLFCYFKTARISTGYIALTLLSFIWLIPIAWILMNAIRATDGQFTDTFFPNQWTLNNFVRVFTDRGDGMNFGRWFVNTLFVSAASMAVSAVIILSTAYAISRSKFKGRKQLLGALLIMGMFPGFMAMIAVYFMLLWVGLSYSLIALIAIYSGSAALGHLIVKGYFDTLPQSIEEAAYIDGATRMRVFLQIIIPLSKPIIIFTLLTSFIAPWGDFIFAGWILGTNRQNFTVAVGLVSMLSSEYINAWYTRFAAGAILVSLPIAGLFVSMQKYYSQGVTGAVKG